MGGLTTVRWSQLLLADLQARATPDRLLFLYVDREVLGRLSGLSPAEALGSFCRAFSGRPASGPFHQTAAEACAWRLAGYPGPPAFAADLAMTVLAVTEVPLGDPHGVYRRQNELLGLPTVAAPPAGYGVDVPVLWREWNRWLEGPGRYLGGPTAEAHEHWTLQGWARSQALVRHRDRHRIDRFFDDMGASPSNDILLEFTTWLQYRGRDGADLLHTLESDAARSIYRQVLNDEAQRWRQEGPRARAASGTRGLLVYDDWSDTFRGAFEVNPAWVGRDVELGNGESQTVAAADDFVMLFPPTTDSALLADGVAVDVEPNRPVRLGGEPVYVFRDEPRVGGRLQARTSEHHSIYHLLVHQTRLAALTTALAEVGVVVAPSASSVDGWSWCESVVVGKDSPALRLLGLAAALADKSLLPRLVGGLKLNGSTYLVGGEPDILDPAPGTASVTLDGREIPRTPNQTTTSLAAEAPQQGRHRVMAASTELNFTTVDPIRGVAAGSQLHRPAVSTGTGFILQDATRNPVSVPRVSGAVVEGVAAPLPVVMMLREGAELLVVLADRRVLQVITTTPKWLADIDVCPYAVDVMDAVRETGSPVEIVVVWSPGSRGALALAVPTDAVVPLGKATTVDRADVVAQLLSAEWTWRGPPDHRAKTRLMNAAMGSLRLSKNSQDPKKHDAVQPLPMAAQGGHRRRVLSGPVANPYDDVLGWLSEQEDLVVGWGRFADAWAWSCQRRAMAGKAAAWRQALNRLVDLGHVEREYDRQMVGLAPAALVSLPDSAGLSVLTGARPDQVVERLEDPDDQDAAVGAMAGECFVHRRTPVDAAGSPDGPTAVYVEWDPAEEVLVRRGLGRLGVELVGCTGSALARMLPPLAELLTTSQQFTMPPGRDVWLYQNEKDLRGGWSWRSRATDAAIGFYRYRLARGDVYAWRGSLGGDLTEVEPALGKWLAWSAVAKGPLLRHHGRERVLLAPADLTLPEMARRALALRTGLPPFRLSGFRPGDGGAGRDHLAWDNVDRPTANRVASLLGQPLANENGTLSMEDM